jgi:hypothetical protein
LEAVAATENARIPVLDESGTAIDMISEGDLVGRDEAERNERREWWLALLAEGALSDALTPLRWSFERPLHETEPQAAPMTQPDETSSAAADFRRLLAGR